MRLSGVRSGDIVQAGGAHWIVIEKRDRRLVVASIGAHGIRRLRADEVDRHWRQVRVKVRA
jgi:ABC-type bacteriocin/lantibiotic exporter with double-glycine peptidase domain